MTYSFEPVSVPSAEDVLARESAGGAVVDRDVVVDSDASGEEALPLPEFRSDTSMPGPGGAASNSIADFDVKLEVARAEAHRQGVEEGRRAEAERVRTALEAVKVVVSDLRIEDKRREQEANDRVAALATGIAGHLIEREIRASPEVVSDLVRRAIAEFPVNDPLAVHLNPSDLALLSRGLSDDASHEQLTSGQSVRWIPDPTIRSGGCLIEGENRVVDARLSRILERVFGALTDG